MKVLAVLRKKNFTRVCLWTSWCMSQLPPELKQFYEEMICTFEEVLRSFPYRDIKWEQPLGRI